MTAQCSRLCPPPTRLDAYTPAVSAMWSRGDEAREWYTTQYRSVVATRSSSPSFGAVEPSSKMRRTGNEANRGVVANPKRAADRRGTLSDSQCDGLMGGHLFPLLPDQRKIVVGEPLFGSCYE